MFKRSKGRRKPKSQISTLKQKGAIPMKKLICIISIMALLPALLLLIPALAAETSCIPGDVDGNGKVDITDARLILQHLVHKIELTNEQKERAKMNGNSGEINVGDAREILQALVRAEDTYIIFTKERPFISEYEYIPIEPLEFSYDNEDYAIIYDAVFNITGNPDLSEFKVDKAIWGSQFIDNEWVATMFNVSLQRYFDGVQTDSFYSLTFHDGICDTMGDSTVPFDPSKVKPLRQPSESEKQAAYEVALSKVPKEYIVKERKENIRY